MRSSLGVDSDSRGLQAIVGGLGTRTVLVPKRPRDPNALGKRIVDEATGEAEPYGPDEGKDPLAVELGRRGGLKGGKARAESMTKAERVELAKKAARARWAKKQ
jgi:hypothetical protein